MSVQDYLSLAYAFAATFSLPPQLVAAMMEVESGGNPYAWNPEPRYHYLWDVRAHRPFRVLSGAEISSEVPPRDFPCLGGDRDQEWWGQKASWGLMQVMGAVAREVGFAEPYLPRLCDPATGLKHGCLHLAQLRDRHFADDGWDGVIAAYNEGSPRKGADGRYLNQVYVDRVRRALNGAEL